MDHQTAMWLTGIAFTVIVTFVGCTASVVIFLWKRFDTVFAEIEKINIAQHEYYVKHEICKEKIRMLKIDWCKDIQNKIYQHEKEKRIYHTNGNKKED